MEFLSGIPDILYKYRVWEEPCTERQYQRRILTDNEIYLASFDQFNDPFDGAIPFRYKTEQLTPENIYLKLRRTQKIIQPDITDDELERVCYERQATGVFDDGQYWRNYYPTFKKDINEMYGVLSLTSKRDNILMWSHYANCHQGFCVGLSKHVLFQLIKGSIGPVIYDDKFPEMEVFDEDDPNALGLFRLVNTKSLDWKYEQEYRIIKHYSRRTVYSIPNEGIVEIILGCQMPEAIKNLIVQIANEKFPHAKLFQSNLSQECFVMDMIPIFRAIK